MSDDETPKHEAVLCANSCLSILKTVFSYVRRDSSLLYDCLEAIEMCTATLKPEAVQGDARHVSRIAEEALRVVKKWLKQLLSDRVPCYNDSSRHEELTVWTCFILFTNNFHKIILNFMQTTSHIFHSLMRVYCNEFCS